MLRIHEGDQHIVCKEAIQSFLHSDCPSLHLLTTELYVARVEYAKYYRSRWMHEFLIFHIKHSHDDTLVGYMLVERSPTEGAEPQATAPNAQHLRPASSSSASLQTTTSTSQPSLISSGASQAKDHIIITNNNPRGSAKQHKIFNFPGKDFRVHDICAAVVTAAGYAPYYKLWRHQCYWFAMIVYCLTTGEEPTFKGLPEHEEPPESIPGCVVFWRSAATNEADVRKDLNRTR